MCDCIEKWNKEMFKLGARIDVPPQVDMRMGKPIENPRIKIPLYKIDPKSRKALPVALAVFCPFCGKEYSSV